MLLPCARQYQVIDEYFELVLSDALFKEELIILHDCIDVQLHVQLLQALILTEPYVRSILCDIKLPYLPNQLFYFLLMQDVPNIVLHLFII